MPVPRTSFVIQRSLLRTDVYVYLREAILDGHLPPGSRLQDATLEQMTGASRTPIREALHRLRSEGFVEVFPQRATRVGRIDPVRLRQALVVERHLIESVLPEVIPRLSDGDLACVRSFRDAVEADPECEIDLLCNGEAFAGISGMFLRVYGNHTVLRAAHGINRHLRWAVGADRRLGSLLAAGPRLLTEFVAACGRRDVAGVTELIAQYCADCLDPYLESLDRRTAESGSFCWTPPARPRGVSRNLLSEQVHRTLLNAIIDGQFASGERLRDEELTAWLGVSRTPLREALMTLEQVGLIETLPGRLTRVVPVDRDNLIDSFTAMTIFGVLSVRLGITRLTAAGRATLHQSIDAISDAVAREHVTDALLATNAYLHTLTSATGNRALELIEERIVPRLFNRVKLDPPLDLRLLETELRSLHAAVTSGKLRDAERAVAALYEPAAFTQSTP